jgi:hypothetical protein
MSFQDTLDLFGLADILRMLAATGNGAGCCCCGTAPAGSPGRLGSSAFAGTP